MKSIIVLILTYLYSGLNFTAEAQTGNYTIPRVEISDNRVSKAILDYIEEFNEELGTTKGITIVRFEKGIEDSFYTAFKVYKIEILKDPPTFYSILGNNIVLFYTGIESYLKYGEDSFKSLFRESKGSLIEDQITYSPIVWKITLTEKNYEKKIVETLPY